MCQETLQLQYFIYISNVYFELFKLLYPFFSHPKGNVSIKSQQQYNVYTRILFTFCS